MSVASKSLPSSAENTINRPRQTESGPGHANTLHIDRAPSSPPPYGSATLTTPYVRGIIIIIIAIIAIIIIVISKCISAYIGLNV